MQLPRVAGWGSDSHICITAEHAVSSCWQYALQCWSPSADGVQGQIGSEVVYVVARSMLR